MTEFETRIISAFAKVSPTRAMVWFLGDDRTYYIYNDEIRRTMFSLLEDELRLRFCSWSWGIKELSANRRVRIKARYDIHLPGYVITDMQFLKEENTMVITARPTKISCEKDVFMFSYYDANRDKETTYSARRGRVLCFERVTRGEAKEITFDEVLDFLMNNESRHVPFNISVTDGLIRSITIDRTSGRAWGKTQAYLTELFEGSKIGFLSNTDSTPCPYCKQEKEKEEMDKFLVPKIEKVLFEDPATIVFWKDGTKTVVKAQDGEKFDREKGLAMAISKKALGNDRGYYFTFQRYKAIDKPAAKKETVKTTETPTKPTTKNAKKAKKG